MVELADIFRLHGPAYRAKFDGRMLPSHLKAMQAIEQCRTETLGGHVYLCRDCGETEYSYHSCKNRSCPKCQNEETTQWLEKQRALLLPVPYFLNTYTLPDELRDVARSHQETVYSILLQSSAAALKELALDPKYLGGKVGMVGVLQTWARDLASHLHVHYLVPGGALSLDDQKWLSPRYKDWLVPVKALSKVFRRKFKKALTKAGLIGQVPRRVWKKNWVVHCKPAGTGPEALQYLAPYIYRIAISNNRIEELENGQVTFRYKESDTGQWQRTTLPAEELIRRFLQHVLPKGFIKVRYYGFLSPTCRESLGKIKNLLGTVGSDNLSGNNDGTCQSPHAPQPEQKRSCRHCGGQLVLVFDLPRNERAPPG